MSAKMPAKTQRYLFETSFDADRAALGAGAQDAQQEPTFSAEDLQKARDAAYAEGEAAGRQDAVNSIEKQLLNGLGRMVQQLGALTGNQARFQQELTEKSVELALKATRKMLPALAQRDGLAEIEALLRDCLQEAREEPRIVIHVAEPLLAPFRERLDEMARHAGYGGAITLLDDDALGPADCRVEWANGGAERIAERMWQEFEAATQRIFRAEANGTVVNGQAPPSAIAATPVQSGKDTAAGDGPVAAPLPDNGAGRDETTADDDVAATVAPNAGTDPAPTPATAS